MAYTLELYRRLIAIRIRAQMQYRSAFLADVFTTAVLNGASFFSLALVLQRFDGIKGWSLWEVALLFGTVDSAFGMMDMIFSGFDPDTFGQRVRMGDFDRMLLRPVPVELQVFSAEFLLRRLGRILEGGAILLLAMANLPVEWNAWRVGLIALAYVSQVAFFGGLFMIGAAITFWTVESIEAINVLTYGGQELNSFPYEIYNRYLVYIFTYLIPGIFINYYPVLTVLGKPDPFGMPWFAPYLAPVVGLGMLALGNAFWRFGLRHYQSTGT